MEARGSNNNFPRGGNLTNGIGNIFNAGSSSSVHEGGGGYITPPAPVTSLVQVTGGGGQRSSQNAPPAFTELLRDQHVSLLNGGRLVVELRIESHPAPVQEVVASTDSGSSADNNSGPGTGNDSSDGPRCRCGRKRKTPESGGASANLNRNENATPAADEDGECECEIPPVQGNSSGSMSPHDASSNHGHANQPNQASPEGEIEIIGAVSSQGNPNMANRDVNSNRSGRSRRRGPPQRSVISGNSSAQTPVYQPPPIPVRQGMITVGEHQVPFRIRDYVARRSTQPSAFNLPTSQLTPGGGLGSRVDPPPHSPSYVLAALSDTPAGTLGQTSGDPNPQQGNPSTGNVTVHPLPRSGGLLEQIFYGPNGIITRNANRGPSGGGGHNMELRSGINRRDPRLNSEPNGNPPIGNVQQVATSVTPERIFAPPFPSIADQYFADFLAGDREAAQRLHRHTVRRVLNLLQGRHIFAQGNQVLNNNNEELDGMRLDIDRMTYEDLLALEERIGDVNTGLSEEVIMQRLKPRKHRIYKNKTPEEPETCCICLDEFENRQELGKLDCGHNFHFDCIKQWLMQKNFCPICKKTALPPPKEEA